MGKKNKRRGVVWSNDPSTGSPMGREVNAWDGVSRTTKRTEKRTEIDERRELLRFAGGLDEDLYEKSLLSAQQRLISTTQEANEEDLKERLIDIEVAHERLTDFIERLRDMKRSGAKQRLVKHIYSSLEEEEWALLQGAMTLAKQELLSIHGDHK